MIAHTPRVTILSIVGQHKFYATLSDFLGIMGYWAGNYFRYFRSYTVSIEPDLNH